jgi:hypothetical protein
MGLASKQALRDQEREKRRKWDFASKALSDSTLNGGFAN